MGWSPGSGDCSRKLEVMVSFPQKSPLWLLTRRFPSVSSLPSGRLDPSGMRALNHAAVDFGEESALGGPSPWLFRRSEDEQTHG